MATAEQIKALVDSHGSGDDARFRSVAMQVAARAAKQGHNRLADDIRKMLDAAAAADKVRRSPRLNVGASRAVPITRPAADLAGLLVASYPRTRLSSMVLSEDLDEQLRQIVTEWRQRDRLRGHGLEPRLKLLLAGPPGCGKTMTAAALAGECGLPLMVVQLHGLMTKFMGETAAKLAQVFAAMDDQPAVYLFDEFDAIGAMRDTGGDIGEVRRVLNSFLQFLEQYQGDSLVVAATNLAGLLDDALFRRFDAVLRYTRPDPKAVKPLVAGRLAAFDLTDVDWTQVTQAAGDLSHAEIVQAAEEAARTRVLAGAEPVTTRDLTDALRRRSAFRGDRPIA